MTAPACIHCGRKLRRFKYRMSGPRPAPDNGRLGADGQPREWGDYGDNVLCGITCGYYFARKEACSMPPATLRVVRAQAAYSHAQRAARYEAAKKT